MKELFISDITLKDIDVNPANRLLFREKTALAAAVESFGVNRLELPRIKNSREDHIIFNTIAGAAGCPVLIEVDPYAENCADAYEAVKNNIAPVLGVSLPVSSVQMEYVAHMKADRLKELLASVIKKAVSVCGRVEFTALDSGRADRSFLNELVSLAAACGVSAITLSDDAGDLLPEAVAELVTEVKSEVTLPVYVRLSPASGMQTANLIAAVRAGADGVKTSVEGKLSLSTEELSRTLDTFGTTCGIWNGLNRTQLHTDIKNILKTIGKRFTAGGQKAANDDIAAVYLDQDSNIDSVKKASAMLGYELDDEDLGRVYDAVLSVCRKKHSIEGKELEAVIASTAMQVPSTYHLENYMITSSNIVSSMAQVKLRSTDGLYNGVAGGDGPIDAAFNAIDSSIGHHYELDDLQIEAVTEGKSALGAAVVRLRSNGKLYSGNGLSTDIVGASIRAYINALNKIVFEEK